MFRRDNGRNPVGRIVCHCRTNIASFQRKRIDSFNVGNLVGISQEHNRCRGFFNAILVIVVKAVIRSDIVPVRFIRVINVLLHDVHNPSGESNLLFFQLFGRVSRDFKDVFQFSLFPIQFAVDFREIIGDVRKRHSLFDDLFRRWLDRP